MRTQHQAKTCIVGDPLVPASQRLRGFLTYINKPLLNVTTVSSSSSAAAAFSSSSEAVITAAGCGVVETTEQVLSVRGLFPRFNAEVGDVVVARVADVSGSRWICDVNGSQNAILPLSNVTEPGGMLRRRGRDDEMSMRALFREGDLVVAEVQRVSAEGTILLHTRSASKYGRCLGDGICVAVRPHLIRREGKQFCAFPFGVSAVIGINGNIWVFITTQATLVAMNANWGTAGFNAQQQQQQRQQQKTAVDGQQAADGQGENDDQEADAGDDENDDALLLQADPQALQKRPPRIIKNIADARLNVARTRCCLLLMSALGCRIDANCIQAAFYATRNMRVQDILSHDSPARQIVENAVALARLNADRAARFED